MDKKQFTIAIPHLDWKKIFSFRLGSLFLFALVAALFIHWWTGIRPFTWVSNGKVGAFSVSLQSEPGRVVAMGPKVGDWVKKGDFLFALDTEVSQAMQNKLRKSIDNLHEEIRVAKIRLERAMQEYADLSQKEEMGFEISSQIKKQLSSLEDAQTKAEKAERDLRLANAELSLLEIKEKKMRCNAPFDGIVLKKEMDVGSWVALGQSIYSIYDPLQMWVEAEVAEEKIEEISLGSDVLVRCPAFPKEEIKGKVIFIGPSVHQGKVELKVSLDAPKIPLKPGLRADVALIQR